MTAKRRLTEQEREQRRAQDRQRLKNAAEQLLTSEGWQRWVQVRARCGLARLSLSNQPLVALACRTRRSSRVSGVAEAGVLPGEGV